MAGRKTEQRAQDLFDSFHFLTQSGLPDQSWEDPWRFFLRSALDWPDLNPHPLFETRFYLERNPELARTGENPLIHYLEHSSLGDASNPHPLFDETFYRKTQIPGDVSPLSSLEHYEWFFGADNPPNPNRLFDTAYFLKHNPDVAAAGTNPLAHFAMHSGNEARIVSERLAKKLIDVLGWNEGPTLSDYSSRRMIVIFDASGDDTPASVPFEKKTGEWIWIVCGKRNDDQDPLLRERGFFLDELIHTKGGPAAEVEIATAIRALSSPYKPTHVFAGKRIAESLPESGIQPLPDLTSVTKGEIGPPASSGNPTNRRVIIPLVDWEISGVNTWVENISQGLAKAGWDVILLASPDFYRYTKSTALPALGIRLFRISPRNPRWFWNHLRDFFESQAPAIVLTAYDFKVNSIAAVCGNQLAFVGVLHSDDEEYYEQQKRLGPSFAHTIAVSNRIRENLLKSASADPATVEVIPYGVPIGSAGAAEPPSEKDPIQLIYTGRLVQKQKRILDMARLTEALEARGVQYRLTIIGDGTEKGELETLLAGAIQKGNVEMPGRLAPEDVAVRLSKSHLFVLLSEWEGLPLSLLEAMAHGVVPVVGQIDSGIPELVHEGETGFAVPLGAFEKYAAIIERLWKDGELWKSISSNTKAFFESHYTTEKMVEKTDSVLDAVWKQMPFSKEAIKTPAGDEGKRAGNVRLPNR